MTITITIDGHSAEHVRAEMARLLGTTAQTVLVPTDFSADEAQTLEEVLNPITVPDQPITQQQAETLVEAAKRERGKPSPGRARRTKEEIAEDDAYEATQTRAFPPAPATEEVAAISTGEDRVDPDNPDDVAQDAADEAAETTATKEANGGKLTLDDVRKGLGEYVKLYGMAAAQEDGPKLIQKVLGDETKVKVSDLPDDQAVLAKAVAGTKELCETNPFKRDKVA